MSTPERQPVYRDDEDFLDLLNTMQRFRHQDRTLSLIMWAVSIIGVVVVLQAIRSAQVMIQGHL